MDTKTFIKAKKIWDEMEGYKKDVEKIEGFLNADEIFSSIAISKYKAMFDHNDNYFSNNKGFAINWLNKDKDILLNKIEVLQKKFDEI